MAPLVREALRAVDPDLPLLQPQALSTRIAQTVADRKLALVLLAGFAAPRARARQPGRLQRDGAPRGVPHERDRHSHGARRVAAARSCGWCSATAAGSRSLGIALGIAGALAVSRLMQQALFEVDPADPLIYLAVSATLLLVAECASWFPARRATRIDPVIALRSE